MKNGFSLVELSIVLVILGLLTGGILAGQNLIRAAELRSVSTEFSRYTAAVHTFRDKYFALPGDFRDATKFWGRQLSASHCVTNSAQAVDAAGSCDGDGVFDNPAAASQSGEIFGFWRQLAKAGLIEGEYSGASDAAGTLGATIGDNIPRSKLNQGGWSVYNFNSSGNSLTYAMDYGNFFILGGEASGNISVNNTILTPEEAWNVDTKMDDGRPGYGMLVIHGRGNLVTENRCSIGSSAANDLESDYNLTYTGKVCALYFPQSL